MSCPAQKASPAPVITRTCVSSSIARSSSTSSISRCSCGLMALRLSGRLKITQVMPSSFSTLMVSYFLVVILLSPRSTWLKSCSEQLIGGNSIALSRPPGQDDRPLGLEQKPDLAIGRDREIGGRGDLQADAVADDVDTAGRPQKRHPADPAGEAIVASARPTFTGLRRSDADAFGPDRDRYVAGI